MSHREQREFFERIKSKFPDAFQSARVLDVGSLDVNGCLRPLFTGGTYLGVDLRPGPNVDDVRPVHTLELPVGTFDTVVSAEMLEHDEYWESSLRAMYRMLRSRGLMVISCAAPGRPEHGTAEHPDNEPGFDGVWGSSPGYYRPLGVADIHKVFAPFYATFDDWEILDTGKAHHDLQFWGIKR